MKLKQFRHIAMRFDRNPLNYLAMLKPSSTRHAGSLSLTHCRQVLAAQMASFMVPLITAHRFRLQFRLQCDVRIQLYLTSTS